MAGTQSRITIDYNSQSVALVLDQLVAQAADLQPAMMEIAEYLHERTRDHFDNQEAPDGTPWAPLADSTKARKQAQGVPINKILHGQTLNLRDTIFPFYSSTEAGVSTGPGTEAYAATQHFGDAKRNIEPRPVMGISEADEQEVIAILEQFLAKPL